MVPGVLIPRLFKSVPGAFDFSRYSFSRTEKVFGSTLKYSLALDAPHKKKANSPRQLPLECMMHRSMRGVSV